MYELANCRFRLNYKNFDFELLLFYLSYVLLNKRKSFVRNESNSCTFKVIFGTLSRIKKSRTQNLFSEIDTYFECDLGRQKISTN